MRRRQRRVRRLLLAVSILVVLIAALPLFVSVESFKPAIEQQLSRAIGHEVRIHSLSFRVLPRLRLLAEDIRIDKAQQVARVGSLGITPDVFALMAGDIEITQIRLVDVELTRPFLDALLALETGKEAMDAKDEGIAVRIQEMSFEQLMLTLDEQTTLGPYRASVRLNTQLMPELVRLRQEDNGARLQLAATRQGFHVTLQADDWRLPLGPVLAFKHLKVEALLDTNGLNVTSLQAEAYHGTLDGEARLDWTAGWQVTGRVQGRNIDSERLLAAFLDQPVIAGRFTGRFDYTLQAQAADRLGERPNVQGGFTFRDGVIYNADLEKATNLLGNDAGTGGQTPFRELSGTLVMHNGAIKLDTLSVQSDVLEASGNLRIDPQQQLRGEIEVGVTRTASLVSVPLNVAGTVNTPRLRPTNEAMAGGAVGTGLLGPGVGTAVGVKIGSFIGKLLGGDEEQGKSTQPSSASGAPDPWEGEED